MKTRIFPATVLLFLALGSNQCAATHPASQPAVESRMVPPEPSFAWEPEEYVVYSAFIDQTYLLSENHILPIFDFTIKETRSAAATRSYIRENLSAVEEETLDDFFRKNNRVYVLQRRFKVPVRYYFVVQDHEEEQEIRNHALVTRFINELEPDLPQSMTAFSRVGFNSDRDQALFLVERPTGRKYTLFAKMDDGWLYQGCFRAPPENN